MTSGFSLSTMTTTFKMNKDTIIASSIGFGLGLIAAIALWVVPRILPKTVPPPKSEDVIAQKNVEGETTTKETEESISLSSPQNGEIITKNQVNLEGKVKDVQTVIVTTPQSNHIANPTAEGKFSTTLTLTEGANPIAVAAYSNGREIIKTLTVFYYAEGI